MAESLAVAGRGLHANWAELLERMSPIGLAQLESVAVTNRVDTKFVMRADQLFAALEPLTEEYRVLAIGGGRSSPYRTLYFDTPELDLYARHHSGARIRFKLRKRAYLNTQMAFLEIKSRARAGRTAKLRMPIGELTPALADDELAFVSRNMPLDPEDVVPAIENRFERIALLSKSRAERLTIDLGIGFHTEQTNTGLADVAVAELKQLRLDRRSPFYRQMRRMHVQPTPLSKYCIGLSMTRDGLKHNRFRPLLKRISEISRGVHAGN